MNLLHPTNRPRPENQYKKETGASQQPLRICVVFDEDASARSAEILIRHVASGCQCDIQSFHFDELNTPAPGVAAARSTADTDILMLAARGDRILPRRIRLWLGLSLGLREEGREGALVALIKQVDGPADLHSSIVEYLETVAIIGGLAFFPQQHSALHAFVSDTAPRGRPQMDGLSLNSLRCISGQVSGLASHRNCEYCG